MEHFRCAYGTPVSPRTIPATEEAGYCQKSLRELKSGMESRLLVAPEEMLVVQTAGAAHLLGRFTLSTKGRAGTVFMSTRTITFSDSSLHSFTHYLLIIYSSSGDESIQPKSKSKVPQVEAQLEEV